MNTRTHRGLVAAAVIGLAAVAILAAHPAAQPVTAVTAVSASQEPDAGWPRKVVQGSITILVYQPQIDRWTGNSLEAYSAVAAGSGTRPQSYGVVYFTARTEVDKVNRLVTLADARITRVQFPGDPGSAETYRAILQEWASSRSRTISLDRLEADLATTQAGVPVRAGDLVNDPPRILFSSSPAVLILIDGAPVLRPAQGGLSRVINTRALLLYEEADHRYFLYLLGGWATATDLDGPWLFAANPPAAVQRAKDQLADTDQVDLLTESTPAEPTRGSTRLSASNVPFIYVSSSPAELVQTNGPPQLAAIAGTSLLYVSNTGSDLLLEPSSRSYYLLLSGRWFRSQSLDGLWSFVAGNELPADFARIPSNCPKAGVLVSVPGTQAAEEAVIADQIPQTAAVSRDDAQVSVNYDGPPQFKPINGTRLRYASNCATPVIEVGPSSYYAVYNGVWFIGMTPMGPWAVATSVPSAIYSIPPSCPIYYVTFVRVYGATAEMVYVGYTPGYFGTIVAPWGTVVYGTGWRYRPHVGSIWIGQPWTYGCGASFGWNSAAGWWFDFGVGYWYPIWRPWYGPLRYGWKPRPKWEPNWGHHGWGGFASINVYGHWGPSAVAQTHAGWAHARPRTPAEGGRPPYRDPRTGITTGRPNPWSQSPQTRPGVDRPVVPNSPRPQPGTVRPSQPGTVRPNTPVPRPVPATPRGNPGARPGPVRTPNPAPVRTPPVVPPRGRELAPEKPADLYGTKDGQVYRYQVGQGWQQPTGTRWQPAPQQPPVRQLERTHQGRSLGDQRTQTYRQQQPSARPAPVRAPAPVARPAPVRTPAPTPGPGRFPQTPPSGKNRM